MTIGRWKPGKSNDPVPGRDRYRSAVRGVAPEDLAPTMRASIEAVQALWPPETIVTVFIADPGAPGGGLSYISNGDRTDMISVVREWLRHQETLS